MFVSLIQYDEKNLDQNVVVVLVVNLIENDEKISSFLIRKK